MGNMDKIVDKRDVKQWFVMRDLKRNNAKQPAYKYLSEKNIRVFTPLVWKIYIRQGKKIREKVPFIQDLLFVYDCRRVLDPIVEMISTLQYRFIRGKSGVPMTVRDDDMERFMKAVAASEDPYYYTPEEIHPSMIGKKVRIIGGPLNGYEGNLQKIQGSRIKRLFVELPNLFTLAVEVQPEFIQLVKER